MQLRSMLASHEPWAPTDGDASSQGEIQQGGNAYEAGGGESSARPLPDHRLTVLALAGEEFPEEQR